MLKVKLITGYRRDQEYSINAQEAHKAYWLFLHPESRGVFNDGLAIKGDSIEEIVPDYQGSMGWNATHVLGDDDWNEIKQRGMDRKLRNILTVAKSLSASIQPEELNEPMETLVKQKYPSLQPGSSDRAYSDPMKPAFNQ